MEGAQRMPLGERGPWNMSLRGIQSRLLGGGYRKEASFSQSKGLKLDVEHAREWPL